MLIDEITVQCIEQCDLVGKDTLIFKINGVRIFNIQIGSGESKSANLTDIWPIEIDSVLTIELNNSLTPNRSLVSYKVTGLDIDNRKLEVKITEGCEYFIEMKM